mgnify:CR=1 FL=1
MRPCAGPCHPPAIRAADCACVLWAKKGSAYAAGGQMLPPYDSAATLTRLEVEVAALDPARVVLLGDSFHDTRAIGRMAPDDRSRLDRLAAARDWIWLEGNHDRLALGEDLTGLTGTVVEALSLGALPAFGAFTGGLDVRNPAIAGLFTERPMAAALGRDRVHALAWAALR